MPSHSDKWFVRVVVTVALLIGAALGVAVADTGPRAPVATVAAQAR